MILVVKQSCNRTDDHVAGGVGVGPAHECRRLRGAMILFISASITVHYLKLLLKAQIPARMKSIQPNLERDLQEDDVGLAGPGVGILPQLAALDGVVGPELRHEAARQAAAAGAAVQLQHSALATLIIWLCRVVNSWALISCRSMVDPQFLDLKLSSFYQTLPKFSSQNRSAITPS